MGNRERCLLLVVIQLLGCAIGSVYGQGEVTPDREALMATASEKYLARERAEALALYEAVTTDHTGRLIIDSLTGEALHRMGACAYSIRDTLAASGSYRRAIDVRRKVFGELDNQVAKSQANLGYSYLRWGRLDSADHFLYAATDKYAQLEEPDTLTWIRALSDLGEAAAMRQDRQVMEDVAITVPRLLAQFGSSMSTFEVIKHHYNIGLHANQIKLFSIAEVEAQAALSLSESSGELRLMDKINNLLSIMAFHAGNYEEAIRRLKLAIDLCPPDDRKSLAWAHHNLGLIHIRAGQYREALSSAGKATELAPEGHAVAADAHNVLATTYAALNDPIEAEKHFATGIKAINSSSAYFETNIVRQDIARLNAAQLEQLAIHLEERGAFYRNRNEHTAALRDYMDILKARSLLRGRVTSDASRQYLSQNTRLIFDAAVEINIQLHEESGEERYLWQALRLSDQARAYTLNNYLQRNREELPVREAALERRIGRLEATSTGKDGHEEELVNARLELDRLRRRNVAAPAFDATHFERADLLSYLRDHTTRLLQFHLTANSGFAFHVTPPGELTVARIPGGDTLALATQAFRKSLRESAYRRKSLRPAAEQASLDSNFLHTGLFLAKILPPIGALPQVPGSEKSKVRGNGRLLIVADGALDALPFAALPLEEAGNPFRNNGDTYFGSRTSIYYAYSVSSLLQAGQRTTENAPLIAVAPQFSGSLAPLEYNQQEVDRITGSLGNITKLMGADAVRGTYLKSADAAGILHLSTHGYSDPTNPNASWVAFSQSGDHLDPNQLLYYPEIATHPLKADLVVLSACETNLGKYIPGETSLSLASAFTAAGARSTVTTLWRVDDRATADLMVHFYAGLATGLDRSAALTRAQQALQQSKDFSHPYYWAGVVLTGEDGPITLSPPSIFSSRLVVLVLATLSLLALVVLAIRYLATRPRPT